MTFLPDQESHRLLQLCDDRLDVFLRPELVEDVEEDVQAGAAVRRGGPERQTRDRFLNK